MDIYESLSHERVLIIAEMSANHGNDIRVALDTIDAIKESGADAVKVQTYTADTLTLDIDKPPFIIDNGSIWDGRNLYELYSEASLPWGWHEKLKNRAEERGLIFFSTPFDVSSADFLEKLGVPLYKIASFEITDVPLIRHVAGKGKPIIISTGIATLADIERAVAVCRDERNDEIVLLQCASSYPASPEEARLRNIPLLKDLFGVVPGLSDHSTGSEITAAAVALGARVIEKHFILDRARGGPDSSFSLEPADFAELVKVVRGVESALSKTGYDLDEKRSASRHFARSLFVAQDVEAGDVVSEENVRSVRPGDGMSPRHLPTVVGKRFAENYQKGTPLSWGMLETSPIERH